jgi:hypothetical protein
MPQACQVCNHVNRLEIDREIVQGKSKTKIGSDYGVAVHSVNYHAEHHLTRQLVSAYTRKSQEWAMDLLDHLRDVVFKAAAIFDRAYAKNTSTADAVALRALSEQRGVFELLAKVIAFSQTKAMEEQQASQQVGRVDLSDFSVEELHLAFKLGLKIGEADGSPILDLSPELLEEPAPDLPGPDNPLHKPLPRPPRVQEEAIEVAPVEAPEPVQEEPEPPKGLPPAPSTEISGGERGLRLGRYLLGRKVYDSLRER